MIINFKTIFRSYIWPVERHEITHVICMSVLMFCTLFSQSVLRILKDSLLIPESSAEVLSFAKVYCVTPCAALFVIWYARLVNRYTFSQMYTIVMIVFLSYFIVFAWVILPNSKELHMCDETLNAMCDSYPHFKWYIVLFARWGYVMFYVMAELWPNIFYVLLFWQLANATTSTNDAKRFYTLFSLFGNSSVIIVGFLIMQVAAGDHASYFVQDRDKMTLIQKPITLVIIASVVSIILVYKMSTGIVTKHKNDSPQLGVVESFRYILHSRYLWLLLVCSASYALTMNLVEVVWKDKMAKLYNTPNAYAEASSFYMMWTGVIILVMTIIGNNLMRRYKWLISAVIAPVLMAVTGSIFFMISVFEEGATFFAFALFYASPVAMAVSFGGIQNVIAKGTKYSIWDTSRELLYIPLNQELKTKGKATVDILSSKIGKSVSGLVQVIIFTIFPSITYSSASPALMIIFIFVCGCWLYSIFKLSRSYDELISAVEKK